MLVWHRRARKTTTAINELIKQALLRKGVYWHIFPTYKDGKDAVWRDPNMLFKIIPKQVIETVNNSDLVVKLKNGSLYQIKGADNPDSLRGAGIYGAVFDEFATMKYDAWGVVEPMLRANMGWAWFVGTPKGKNHLFELYQRGQQGLPEWKSWRLKGSESQIIPQYELDNMKLTMSQALYNQEIETEFLEGEGSVFRGVRDVMISQVEDAKRNHTYVIGIDLAKVTDYTVITVYDRQGNNQVYQERFKSLEWPYQKTKIKAISEKYNRALCVVDATGLGDPIADDLSRAGVPVEPYKLTSESKKEIIEKLSIYIEQKRITLLPLTETMFEFDNFTYEIGPTGRVRYQAIEGFHDDIVIAHALAVSSLQPVYTPPQEVELTVIQRDLRDKLRKQNSNNWEEEYELI